MRSSECGSAQIEPSSPNRAATALDGNPQWLQQARHAEVISHGGPAHQSLLSAISESGSLDDVTQGRRKCAVSYHSAADERDGMVLAQVPGARRAVTIRD